ncbi:ubiquinone biosynthesis accessory factor UbiJ [Teredinibacter turnerae]|uniref:ubiquinone biosynthesis accessory factor UbiJ n=1 Tax=Teredinibacter turnerae TaxID=2426 RepID=UPI0003615E11|nr:hypothetical protein [Teredinibacter turnerae]
MTATASETHFHEFSVLISSSLEKVINSALRYDPGTRAAIGRLPSKTLGIVSTSPAFECHIRATGDQLRFTTFAATAPDVELRGDLRDILSLVFTASTSLANTGVTVKGQIGLLADYQRCFANIDIDWEDALANAIGSFPAHLVAQLGRDVASRWIPNREYSARRIQEFITEELRAVPAREEIQIFGEHVNQLRQGVDRLQLRLDKLSQRRPK